MKEEHAQTVTPKVEQEDIAAALQIEIELLELTLETTDDQVTIDEILSELKLLYLTSEII